MLLVVSLISWRRTKNTKLLLVSVAFLVFFLKGIFLMVWFVFLTGITESVEFLLLIILDLLILLFLYFAIAKS